MRRQSQGSEGEGEAWGGGPKGEGLAGGLQWTILPGVTVSHFDNHSEHNQQIILSLLFPRYIQSKMLAGVQTFSHQLLFLFVLLFSVLPLSHLCMVHLKKLPFPEELSAPSYFCFCSLCLFTYHFDKHQTKICCEWLKCQRTQYFCPWKEDLLFYCEFFIRTLHLMLKMILRTQKGVLAKIGRENKKS